MTTDKKRRALEMGGDEDGKGSLNLALKKEVVHLEDKVKKVEGEMKAMEENILELEKKLAHYEDDEDDDEDDDDDESICDGSPWSVKYHLLKQYKQRHGHCKVPKSDKNLGRWVDNARTDFKSKKKSMTQDRIDKLNKLGFYWGKGYPEPRTWEDYFRELQAYYDTFGHSNVPVDPNPALQNELANGSRSSANKESAWRKASPRN